jgi:hypothetical protein
MKNMKNRVGGMKTLCGLALALGLLLGMFGGCIGDKSQGETESKIQAGISPEDIEWKWYKSKEGGFKFKYPACFVLVKEKERLGKEDTFAWDFDYEWKTNDSEIPNGSSLLITRSDADDKYNRGKSLYEIMEEMSEGWIYTGAVKKVVNTTLDGKPAVMARGEIERVLKYTNLPRYDKDMTIVSKNKGWVYTINFMSVSSEPVPDSWYEEVIRSFRFL